MFKKKIFDLQFRLNEALFTSVATIMGGVLIICNFMNHPVRWGVKTVTHMGSAPDKKG